MLRSTSSQFPTTPAVADQSGIPFGVLVSPLAPLPLAKEAPVRLVSKNDAVDPSIASNAASVAADYDTDVPRCYRCSAYISIHCQITPRSWTCCLCASRNTTPSRYAPHLRIGPSATKHISELSQQVYDVRVSDDVALTPVAYIFVIDMNGDAAYLDAARIAVRKALDVVDGDTLVGVMLYSDTLSFVDARAKGLLRRFSISDDDIAVPEVFVPDQWLRPSCPSLTDTLMTVLSTIQPVADSAAVDGHALGHALGPAMRAALDMVEVSGLTAARLVVIAAGEPNIGVGAIQSTESSETSPDSFPSPSTTFFVQLGVRANALASMVDLYIVSQTPVDVATLTPLAQLTGGRLITYDSPETTLSQDIWQHLNDPMVVCGLFRIRSASELNIIDMYGSGLYRDAEVEEVFRLSCHGHSSTLAVELGFKNSKGFEKRRPVSSTGVQVAFRGIFIEPGMMPQKVLRIDTRIVGVTSDVEKIWDGVDANAVSTLMFQKAIATADDQSITKARMFLFDWLAQLFANVTLKHGSGETDLALSTHSSLRSIPRTVFGLIRSFLFRQGAVAPDLRAAIRCIWEDLSADLMSAAAYPRLRSFAELNRSGLDEMALSAAAVKKCEHPIFLLDALSEVVIYYSERAAGMPNLTFPPPDDCLVMRTRAAAVRDRPVTPRLIICREGSQKDRWFKSYLMDDAEPGAGAQSYSAFMQGVSDAAMDLVKRRK